MTEEKKNENENKNKDSKKDMQVRDLKPRKDIKGGGTPITHVPGG